MSLCRINPHSGSRVILHVHSAISSGLWQCLNTSYLAPEPMQTEQPDCLFCWHTLSLRDEEYDQ